MLFVLSTPHSDTTVLSSLACDCNLVAHVNTQAPYALWMSLFAVVCGTLPIGYAVWPNIIGYLLGWLLIVLSVYLFGKVIVNATGRFSPGLEGWARWVKKGNSELEVLRVDTVKAYNDEDHDESNQRFRMPWKKKGEEEGQQGPADDKLMATKDGSGSGDGDDVYNEDVESPMADEDIDVASAEEGVPLEEEAPDKSPAFMSSMHSEASIEA